MTASHARGAEGRAATGRSAWSRAAPALRRAIAAVALCAVAAAAEPEHPVDPRTVERIAFGSCLHQDGPFEILETVVAARPDLFLFLGDNVYADTTDMAFMAGCYARLGAAAPMQALREACPLLATWDDHDYGLDDAGAEYPQREASARLHLDFFGVADDSPRRTRPGVYGAYAFGPAEQRVQVLLLDTRTFRGPLRRDESRRYVPRDDDTPLLGEAQWSWLAGRLREPARLRLLVSSIQVLPDEHPFEKWANLPRERERLFALLREAGAEGVVVLSGDRHHAELSVADVGLGYPLFELTSSSLNRSARAWRPSEPNRMRQAIVPHGDNFGIVEVDWDTEPAGLSLRIVDRDGDVRVAERIPLALLSR